MEGLAKKEIIRQLQEKILAMEGFRSGVQESDRPEFGLGAMEASFPGGRFPTGVTHEFISPTAACAAASNAFISGLLSTLMKEKGFCMWVSTGRSLFPPALTFFGIEPHHVIFIDVKRDKDALWVMEQGLKCKALAAVVAELQEVSFAESQRLQLAVEKSRVTGFLHRRRPRRENTLACVSRFRVRPIPGNVPEQSPGVGYPAFGVKLEKIRNGRPGEWKLEWRGRAFAPTGETAPSRLLVVPDKKERYA